MKRIVLALCVVLLLALPILAVEPLTDLELASASYDSENDRFLYNGQWYDGSGYPIYTPEVSTTEIEDNTSNTTAEAEAGWKGSRKQIPMKCPRPRPMMPLSFIRKIPPAILRSMCLQFRPMMKQAVHGFRAALVNP